MLKKKMDFIFAACHTIVGTLVTDNHKNFKRCKAGKEPTINYFIVMYK